MGKRDMFRMYLLILALCSVVHVSGVAVAQPARNDCPASDPACSAMIPGFAAIGSLVLAPKTDREPNAGQRFGLAVAPVTLVEPATRVRLEVQVGPRELLPKSSFIRIRGLLPAITVPQGHSIVAGSWAVPLFALPDLSISLPEGLQGSSEVAVALVTPEGTVLAESKTKLVVAARSQFKEPAAAGSAIRITPEDRERALQLHARGLAQLEIGNYVAARRFFELATGAGLPQSVMALAATYDPNELAKLGSLGPRPDLEVARHWYHKARELGAADAEHRLQRLGAR
jgi:hypothetical protein